MTRSRRFRLTVGSLALVVGLGVVTPALGIVNGNSADVGEYPFNVYLSNGCSGSLIDPLYVMTAAHCVTGSSGQINAASMTARIGATDRNVPTQGETRGVVSIDVHPHWTSGVNRGPGADVAILKLKHASSIRPVELATPEGPSDVAFWPPGAQVTAIGWGQTSATDPNSVATRLQETTLSIVNAPTNDPSIDETVITARGNSSICLGDSGGPLFVDTPQGRQQIGVAALVTRGCPVGYQVYFAKTAGRYLARWVRSIIDSTPVVGDVDGDGDGDLVVARHEPDKRVYLQKSLYKETGLLQQASSTVVAHDWFVNNGDQVLLADFNGDRRADLWAAGDSDVWVAPSSGSAFNGPGGAWGRGLLNRGETVRAGDFDADQRSDLFIFTNDAKRDVFVARSTPNGFGPRTKVADNAVGEGETPDVIDVNADGYADVVEFKQGVSGGEIFTMVSNGVRLSDWDRGARAEVKAGKHVTVGHFNYDRRGDVVVFDRDMSTFDVNVAIRGRWSGYSPFGKWHEWFGWAGHTLDAVDVNGDSLDDIVAFTNGHKDEYWVALNQGGGQFGPGQRIGNYRRMDRELPPKL